MALFYDAVIAALRQHWQQHDNQYPRQLILTPQQHAQLMTERRIGSEALNVTAEPSADQFMGVPLAQDPATPGILVAVDGTELPIAGAGAGAGAGTVAG